MQKHFPGDEIVLSDLAVNQAYLGLFGYFFPVVRPPILALGGVQLLLPVVQWSQRTEGT